MANVVGKLMFCATLIGIFIESGFYKINALQCYTCEDEACQKKYVGKAGYVQPSFLQSFFKTKRKYYGWENCSPRTDEHNGSEFCYAIPHQRGVLRRGCGGVRKIYDWDPLKKRSPCPLMELTLKEGDNQVHEICICFTDLCNGDPAGCCENSSDLYYSG